jgi:hypothetical protein
MSVPTLMGVAPGQGGLSTARNLNLSFVVSTQNTEEGKKFDGSSPDLG